MDTIDIEKKERATIERAYELVKGINFPAFVDFIEKHQPEFLEVYSYYKPERPESARSAKSAKTPKNIKKVHIGVDEKPDISKILHRRNTLVNSALGKFIERYKEYPTPEFKLQDNLNMLAEFVIAHEDYIHKIKKTNFPFFDMERIGEIWAYAEMFLKYREVLQGLEQKDKAFLEAKTNSGEKKDKSKKIAANFYALYHWILIEIGKERNFETNDEDKYSKQEIETFAANRYGCSVQGFYRAFIKIDISRKTDIARDFKRGYKDKLIMISNNDRDVITHLKKYPN